MQAQKVRSSRRSTHRLVDPISRMRRAGASLPSTTHVNKKMKRKRKPDCPMEGLNVPASSSSCGCRCSCRTEDRRFLTRGEPVIAGTTTGCCARAATVQRPSVYPLPTRSVPPPVVLLNPPLSFPSFKKAHTPLSLKRTYLQVQP
jgi:hypothetical protein